FLQCLGVLHHTSHPTELLKEFHRVLKFDGKALIMVYNANSLWLHLYTAYQKMIVENAYPGLSLADAFTKSTDGPDCPISRCYDSVEFIALCNDAGFTADYDGGYLSTWELSRLKEYGEKALTDERLQESHKEFIKSLTYDEKGYPLHYG